MAPGFSQDPLRDQFFLQDASALEQIVSLAGIRRTDTVLEVGAGDGRLTGALSEKCRKVIAVEMDERLSPVLSKKFPASGNVKILFGNALKLLPGLSGRYDVIVSNPPYSISEPLVKLLFGESFREAVLTLPADFVSRLTANPEEPAYSKLSLFAHAFFRIETLMPVWRDAWQPRPRTDSMVVRLIPRKPSSARERLAREMALQEDKKLRNALREAIVRTGRKTKRQARSAIEGRNIRDALLEKKVSSLSLREIEEALSAL